MRRRPAFAGVSIAATVVALALALAGCSRGDGESAPRPSEEFCEAALEFERGLEQRFEIEEQIRLLEPVVAAAPRAIRADARTFLEALEAVRADPDDPDVVDDPDVQAAVENVERYVIDGCGVYEGSSPF